MAKNISAYGIFKDRLSLERAITALKLAGFRNEDVSMLLPENLGNKDLVTEKNTKSPEGAVAGGATGGIIGGALGWLVGAGVLAIPGLGPFLAAGPIVAAMAGIGAGAVAGGLAGALIGMGTPEFVAKRYEGRVKNGGSLLSVHCDSGDWAESAVKIMRSSGGEDVTKASQASADYDTSDKPYRRADRRLAG